MNITIELVEIGAPKRDGKFDKMELVYMRDGKKTERKLVAINKTKEVIQKLQQFQKGDVCEVEMEKVGDFWNWNDIKKVEAPKAAEVKGNTYQRQSTYETPEERAKKQVYIIKQSSIANAIAILNAGGQKYEYADVIELADRLVDYVLGTFEGQEEKEVADGFKDDIPF